MNQYGPSTMNRYLLYHFETITATCESASSSPVAIEKGGPEVFDFQQFSPGQLFNFIVIFLILYIVPNLVSNFEEFGLHKATQI